ncbi:MAG: DUF72 domain-containing protein [Alphaproteobacteria bacterium]|nr:DUF72 domain-containing protein [Alphaproteobacteria bacterium]
MARASEPRIRVGVGGWTFAPWRGAFYPDGLTHKRELEYASRKLTAIEINGTYYGSQKPESFARWRDETPDGFVFSLKGPRFTTNRRVLAEAGPSVDRFLASGVLELKEKLGPINWQFMATKRYDPEDFAAFLALLPRRVEGWGIRHVVEVRHASFRVPEFVATLRDHGVGIVLTDSDEYPNIHDVTAPFVYARLMRASADEAAGYPAKALDAWAKRARAWAAGGAPDDLPLLAPAARDAPKARDVFVYMINGFKPKAPAAAMALLDRLADG